MLVSFKIHVARCNRCEGECGHGGAVLAQVPWAVLPVPLHPGEHANDAISPTC